jgi:hypothetical protein
VGICDDFTDPARATGVLTEAGYRTGPHPDDEELLAVWPPAGQTPAAPARGERGRRCVECAEVLTSVESAASRVHRWQGRCAVCQAEHLAQAADAADQD